MKLLVLSTPIKICKNCGRYFIPVNRNAEIYCDLSTAKGNTKKCRELSARTTYTKNIQDIEGLLLYRRIKVMNVTFFSFS